MKETIKFLGEQVNQAEVRLRKEVMDLDNHMNHCECDDDVKYSFYNIIPHHEHRIFCLNCGGIIEDKD